MSKRDTFKYRVKDGNEIVYYGITNDLERREQEHRNEGMNFTSMGECKLNCVKLQ